MGAWGRGDVGTSKRRATCYLLTMIYWSMIKDEQDDHLTLQKLHQLQHDLIDQQVSVLRVDAQTQIVDLLVGYQIVLAIDVHLQRAV